MSKPPFISVIIPTCFRNQLLAECVGSILRQPYPAFEVIIIDQAEGQELQTMLKESFQDDKRIRYFHVERAGAARARNIGISHAAGSIVAFIDDDAVAGPAWLAGVSDACCSRDKIGLMAGRILPLWNSARPEWYPAEREFLLGLYDIGSERRELPQYDLPIGANMAGFREVILAHGGFDESLGPNHFRKRKMVTGEETILGKRIRQSGYNLMYEPNAVVLHRISSYKLTRSFFLSRHFWEGVTVVEQMSLLNDLERTRWPHYRHHAREVCMALARFALPGFEARYSEPHPAIRMLALSRVAYSFGVLYGMKTLPHAPGKPEATCV